MLLVRQEVGGQGQPTPGEHRHQTVLAKHADQAIERHGRDMADERAPLQAEATLSRQQGIASHLRAHLARAQDEVGQNGEHMP